jgi:hypothetical protein
MNVSCAVFGLPVHNAQCTTGVCLAVLWLCFAIQLVESNCLLACSMLCLTREGYVPAPVCNQMSIQRTALFPCGERMPLISNHCLRSRAAVAPLSHYHRNVAKLLSHVHTRTLEDRISTDTGTANTAKQHGSPCTCVSSIVLPQYSEWANQGLRQHCVYKDMADTAG